jgi:hypothetical protein
MAFFPVRGQWNPAAKFPDGQDNRTGALGSEPVKRLVDAQGAGMKIAADSKSEFEAVEASVQTQYLRLKKHTRD